MSSKEKKTKENSYSQKTAISPILGQLAGSGHEVEKCSDYEENRCGRAHSWDPQTATGPSSGTAFVCVCECVDRGRG